MINNNVANKEHIGLVRQLGLFDSIMLIVGMVIGSGIFLTTGNRISADFTFNPAGLSFGQLLTGFGLALIAASCAYNGWNYFTFMAEEVKEKERLKNKTVVLIISGSKIGLHTLRRFLFKGE